MSKVEVTLSPIRLWAFLLVDLCIPLDYGNHKFDFMYYWSEVWIREPLCSWDNARSARLHFWHCLKRKHCLFTNSWEQEESNAILWSPDIPEDRRPTSCVPIPLSTEVNVISLLQFLKFKYRSITRGVWLNYVLYDVNICNWGFVWCVVSRINSTSPCSHLRGWQRLSHFNYKGYMFGYLPLI